MNKTQTKKLQKAKYLIAYVAEETQNVTLYSISTALFDIIENDNDG